METSREESFPQIDLVIKREGNKVESLIQILHGVQEMLGYLSVEVQDYIAKKMNIPPSKVFGIVSFYNFFKTEKDADHVIMVCMGTACYVKGAAEVMKKFESELHIRKGQITPDKKFSIREVRCLGACGMAPVISVDGTDIYGRLTPEQIPGILSKYQ
ncbi:MAG: NAD(P)H-dependent oxidoreductase subunit E [Caldisericia bacterium]|nr:NAD(P)H-dependent oxidoreductase subunit E [Caldisericia bacterium]